MSGAWEAGAAHPAGPPAVNGANGADLTGSATTTAPEWPASLGDAALHGLAGEVIRAIEPHSEADPAALLVQFLVAFGSIVGRGPHCRVGATRHAPNLFAVVVGATGQGRKGTGWDEIKLVGQLVDPTWRRASGLSSGEGLIFHVRDPIESINRKGEREVIDEGESDKRLLDVETEFASVLRSFERDGNRLSATLRQAWDSGDLATLIKNDPNRATGAHVSIVAHVTPDEVLRYLTTTEAANGLANRFLWVCARRSKYLPDGGTFADEERAELARRVRQAVDMARGVERVSRTPAARALWHSVYPRLCDRPPGLLGAVVGRAEAQVLRLSLVYALLDSADAIDAPHLRAALEVWRYCADSARYIFGETLGDPIADELLRALRAAGPDSMTRTEIHAHLGRHARAPEIDRALTTLESAGMVRRASVSTGGRPAEQWFAVRP